MVIRLDTLLLLEFCWLGCLGKTYEVQETDNGWAGAVAAAYFRLSETASPDPIDSINAVDFPTSGKSTSSKGAHAPFTEAVVRAPSVAKDEGSFVPSAAGIRVEAFLHDLEVRGGAQTAVNRTAVARALSKRELSRCGLCGGAAVTTGQ